MDVAHQAERMSGCGKHYPILSDWNGRITDTPNRQLLTTPPNEFARQATSRPSRTSRGLRPVHRLNAREKAAGSEKPTR